MTEEQTTQIAEYSKTEQALAELREEYADKVYDVATTAGLTEAKAARKVIKTLRGDLEGMRKDLKAPVLDRGKLIDGEAARIKAELLKIEGPIDEQIKKRETEIAEERERKRKAEVKRVEDIQDRIATMRTHVEAAVMSGVTAANIRQSIKDLGEFVIDGSFDEFEEQAQSVREAVIDRLVEMEKAASEREAEEERLRQEREELERDKAEQDKRDAEAREQQAEADRKRQEGLDAQQAELDKQREEQEAKDAEIAEREEAQAQKDRDAAEAEERAAKEKRVREEREAQEAEDAKKAAERSEYPGIDAIAQGLADHFNVEFSVASLWLKKVKEEL